MPHLIKFNNYYPFIANEVFIASGCHIIGDVEIGEGSSIWYNSVIRGDVCPIRIGKMSNIQDGTVIHVTRQTGPTFIGDYVTIGHKAMIHACTIKDYGFVGMNATLLDGVIVESFAMVAAGSVVPPKKIVKTNEIWAGNPAKFLRYLTDEEQDYIKQSAINYFNLSQVYLNQNKHV
ncbi:gamma carbonic anhydrase family protein [Rickettsiales endosymbiont of Stachyamoeba lipophora]|uniref:gamma carbonic anhydrase family protein n=1 Tax=Rickettsiales endosymbiont of Stachyamoeba lipophora TaxID=2486578 RepID=UPI000F64A14C|nr:gamma carbonic anhydrase family protein [Rickettsiales endosymbiont of Stachyamoeba lipophora]AZL15842.1 gamma carbonic anhydrase family protein [Rickettsiales endosymbiont of Stachyamoeba lipophora]